MMNRDTEFLLAERVVCHAIADRREAGTMCCKPGLTGGFSASGITTGGTTSGFSASGVTGTSGFSSASGMTGGTTSGPAYRF